MSEGVKRIAAERQRQIEVKMWSAEHDDEHVGGQMALVAALYAAPIRLVEPSVSADGFSFYDPWPEDWGDGRPLTAGGILRVPTPRERVRLLTKAGALIAAEIDRLLRDSLLRRKDTKP